MVAQGFEGVQQFKITTEDGKGMVVVQSRMGRKLRVETTDFAGGGGISATLMGSYTIIDLDTRDIATIMPVQQMVMTGNLDSLAGRLPFPDVGKATETPLQETGRDTVVAGLPCTIWSGTVTIRDTTSRVDACIAKDAGMVTPRGTGSLAGGLGPRAMDPALERLMEQGYGVVKFDVTLGGRTTSSMELLSLERRPLPESDFEPPKDFRRVDMNTLLPPAPRAKPREGS